MSDFDSRMADIERVLADATRPLTIREIAAAIGVRSPATAHVYVKALEGAGIIRRVTGYELEGRIHDDPPTDTHRTGRARAAPDPRHGA